MHRRASLDAIESIGATGNPTSGPKAQAKSARKLTLAITNLRAAVNSHQAMTGIDPRNSPPALITSMSIQASSQERAIGSP